MRVPVWIAFLVLVVVAVPAALAGIHPGSDVSDQPPGIALVGHASGPDPLGRVTYVVRDVYVGTPLAYIPVTLDFSACAGIRVFSDVVSPGVMISCQSVTAVTDEQGRATFSVVGAGTPGIAGAAEPCVTVRVVGRPFRTLAVSVFDLDGVNGVNGVDASILAADLFSGQYRGRTDYDFDGDVDGIDLGLFARALFGGGSLSSGTTACTP